MTDPAIKTPQLDHQEVVYLDQRDALYFGILDEMGLGKSKVMTDVCSHLFFKNKIDGLLIVAPNSVYTNWISEELPKHCAAPYVRLLFNSDQKGEKAQLRRALFLSPYEWRGKLRVLCMSYDGLRTDHGFKLASDFALLYRTMIIGDESTAFKNPATATAKKMKKIREHCHYAWIASGTAVADKPFDIHSQIEFLCPDFWARHGMKSLSAFKTQFGVYEQRRAGQRVWSECVGYQNVDRLRDLIKSITIRRLKEDSNVKLPPKLYKTIKFDLHPQQKKAYEELRKQYLTELDDGLIVEAPLAIVRLTRLQQISSGFVTAEDPRAALDRHDLPHDGLVEIEHALTEEGEQFIRDNVVADDSPEAYEEFMRSDPQIQSMILHDEPITQHDYNDLNDERENPFEPSTWATNKIKPRYTEKKIVDVVEPKDNPRLKILLELVEQCCHKMIIWCRFRRDVDNVCIALGDQCVRYDGSVGRKDREITLLRFKDKDDPVRVFVANVHSISQGVTLTIAKTMVYYSNSFSPEKRLQSEDRFHRIGQDSPVLIIDLVARNTVDVRLIDGLRKKYELSAAVLGDRFREWVQPASDDEEES